MRRGFDYMTLSRARICGIERHAMLYVRQRFFSAMCTMNFSRLRTMERVQSPMWLRTVPFGLCICGGRAVDGR